MVVPSKVKLLGELALRGGGVVRREKSESSGGRTVAARGARPSGDLRTELHAQKDRSRLSVWCLGGILFAGARTESAASEIKKDWV